MEDTERVARTPGIEAWATRPGTFNLGPGISPVCQMHRGLPVGIGASNFGCKVHGPIGSPT